ncbi:GntR family transcriptional regulator [Achromobacter sp. GG226]|uniref:GntR family transcriptional regulator n=1 Tax=Verticiella alkaliphila TaxID=2779529 RepID=UPI001C0AED62|nr:GntR family transcriptional regulator [Verticiella sp. GG226]MBU4611293.1 GntR family transcriptional regulator [Verticiella sp. GG226]
MPAAVKSRPPATLPKRDDIHERIYRAISEHRLRPGTKLPEERLAELFEVSRTQVRGALQRLAIEQLVTLVPNRGAFVATPTAEEARDVLAVRRTLEPSVVQRLIERMGEGAAPDAVARLRELIARERDARAQGDRPGAIRLSGEFHVLLAELSGSSILSRMMRELTPLTCLAILTFDAPLASACPNDDHAALVSAIEAGDLPGALAVMAHHLHHIESALRLDRQSEVEVDLAEVLFG